MDSNVTIHDFECLIPVISVSYIILNLLLLGSDQVWDSLSDEKTFDRWLMKYVSNWMMTCLFVSSQKARDTFLFACPIPDEDRTPNYGLHWVYLLKQLICINNTLKAWVKGLHC